jgi:hypothetical protein
VKASLVTPPTLARPMSEPRVNRKEGFIGDRGIIESEPAWETAVAGNVMSFRAHASSCACATKIGCLEWR